MSDIPAEDHCRSCGRFYYVVVGQPSAAVVLVNVLIVLGLCTMVASGPESGATTLKSPRRVERYCACVVQTCERRVRRGECRGRRDECGVRKGECVVQTCECGVLMCECEV